MKPAVPREIVCVFFFVPAGCHLKVGHDRFFLHPFTFIVCCPPNAVQLTITALFNKLYINRDKNIILSLCKLTTF